MEDLGSTPCPARTPAPPASALRTTLLVSDLYCPSCVSHIEGTLARLRPRPYAVSHSIVLHTVVVDHNPSLRVSTISKALEEAGYDVDNVIRDPSSTDSTSFDAARGGVDSPARTGWFKRAWRRIVSSDLEAEASKKRKRHLEHCEPCQKQVGESSRDTAPFTAVDGEKAHQDASATRVHTSTSLT